MKKLNPLQREYLQTCKLLQTLNMPTDLFDDLFRAHSYKNKIEEIKKHNEYLESFKDGFENYEQLLNNIYENKN